MHVEPRVLIQPFPDRRVFVGGIVIADQVQLLVLRRLTINLAQELQPLYVAVCGGVFADIARSLSRPAH